MDVDSIDTDQEQRNVHLNDAKKFPKITFKSTSFIKTGDDEFDLKGNLTMKDVTKPVTLKVEFGGSAADFYGNLKSGFEVTGKINLKKFGLT